MIGKIRLAIIKFLLRFEPRGGLMAKKMLEDSTFRSHAVELMLFIEKSQKEFQEKHPAAGLFRWYFGTKIEFKLVTYPYSENLYAQNNALNPIFSKIKKNYDFAGKMAVQLARKGGKSEAISKLAVVHNEQMMKALDEVKQFQDLNQKHIDELTKMDSKKALEEIGRQWEHALHYEGQLTLKDPKKELPIYPGMTYEEEALIEKKIKK